MKRIKHRDLTHYFLRPHSELPRAYVASCKRFFKEIEQREGIKFAGKFKPEAGASSVEHQALDKC